VEVSGKLQAPPPPVSLSPWEGPQYSLYKRLWVFIMALEVAFRSRVTSGRKLNKALNGTCCDFPEIGEFNVSAV
jgi:hypothetical protein